MTAVRTTKGSAIHNDDMSASVSTIQMIKNKSGFQFEYLSCYYHLTSIVHFCSIIISYYFLSLYVEILLKEDTQEHNVKAFFSFVV